MKQAVIKRYFSSDVFETIQQDFGFLIKKVVQSGFEYDLQIRDNYFNLYYKGNSLGKISCIRTTQKYKITIHKRFVKDTIVNRFNPTERGLYLTFTLPRNQLHPLFSNLNLQSMAQRIKQVPSQEEVTFEQMLITDNMSRNDLIIIDRQVMDKTATTKMDLLALQQQRAGEYQFCIIEVKLGNNPELRGDVIGQLNGYIKRIEANFDDYQKCYEQNFRQKQQLGLLDRTIDLKIVSGVQGVVVVGGYSGIAKSSIAELKKKDPTIKVLQIKNRINLPKDF